MSSINPYRYNPSASSDSSNSSNQAYNTNNSSPSTQDTYAQNNGVMLKAASSDGTQDSSGGVDWNNVDYSGVDWSKVNFGSSSTASSGSTSSSSSTASSGSTSSSDSTSSSGSTSTNSSSSVDSDAAENATGAGIVLTNKSSEAQTYYFYDNFWNGNGTAGANFTDPLKSVTLQPGETSFVSLPDTFKGRIQKGTEQPATWVEFQLKADDDGGAHGDVSLERGYNGSATISSTDGSGASNGFTQDLLSDAPSSSLVTKSDGTQAIAATEADWNGSGNQDAINYYNQVLEQGQAYIVGGTGVPDVASSNNRLAVDFY